MIHPESGCAWPDHIFWPLLLGHRWDANHYGVASEAQPGLTLASAGQHSGHPRPPPPARVPTSDSRSQAWVARPQENCSRTAALDMYTLIVHYVPEHRAEALESLALLRTFWLERFG